MKLTVAAMTVLVGATLGAKDLRAQDARAFAHTVQICADKTAQILTLQRAEIITAKMFAGIEIKIEWLDPSHCPAGAIRVGFPADTPAELSPRSLAYALPYEGTHIVIFYDRIVHTMEARDVPALLAHVMAHEITHVLQGVNRHSREGVMKARWNREDYTQMAWKPLPFAQEDIDLIYRGLTARERRSSGEVAPR
jgi:hypothetical protein